MRKKNLTYKQIMCLLYRLLRTTNDVTGNTLYASSDVYVRNGAYLRCLNVGNTKQANLYHDGTDMQIDATSGDIKIHGGLITIGRTSHITTFDQTNFRFVVDEANNRIYIQRKSDSAIVCIIDKDGYIKLPSDGRIYLGPGTYGEYLYNPRGDNYGGCFSGYFNNGEIFRFINHATGGVSWIRSEGGFAFYLTSVAMDSGYAVDGLDISEYITAWLLGAGAPTRKQNVKTSYKTVVLDGAGAGTIYLTTDGLVTGTAIYGIKPGWSIGTEGATHCRATISADFKALALTGGVGDTVHVTIIGAVA